jgi:hypothetical protein
MLPVNGSSRAFSPSRRFRSSKQWRKYSSTAGYCTYDGSYSIVAGINTLCMP